ncbi:hypothetical protein [Asaia sp. As-1742]|uniref:hypothetical protein n=1 Tax=Asaia sp. As-1742 TaxID=2608325 RepID=UPI00141F1469|nr:hypothetical protein [Asaia sp. As-1742]NIE81668.1 hypothetical protein [Asaia sp. As-1742]
MQAVYTVFSEALVSMPFNPNPKRVYDRLTTNSEHAKFAVTVVMRKFVIITNGLFRDDRFWTPRTV